jgi:site-specific recombinase XerD
MKRTRNVGSVYRPKYRDGVTGELKESAIWWIRYSHHGTKHRESSKSEVRAEAVALLKLRIGQAGMGKPVTSAIRRTTLDDLARLVFDDYQDNQYDTLGRQEDAFNHLRAFFGGDCPADDIVARLPEYKEWRRQQPDGRTGRRNQNPRIGCSVATLNRELAALRHAFVLASRCTPPMVAAVPYIKLSKERNRRLGFFEWEQFVALRDRLPEYLKPVMTVAYFTGWRVPSELLTRKRTHVANGVLVLEAYEGKNEQPRKFPLDIIPELKETIERQLETTRKLEVETGRVIPWLFHNDGNRIVNYLPAWHKAIAAAGPALVGRIPHDFRRTAARNLLGAGVDPLTAMALVGWDSPLMLKRYAIIDEETLKRGAANWPSITTSRRRGRASSLRWRTGGWGDAPILLRNRLHGLQRQGRYQLLRRRELSRQPGR